MSEYTHYWATKKVPDLTVLQEKFREAQILSIIGIEESEEYEDDPIIIMDHAKWTLFQVEGLMEIDQTMEGYHEAINQKLQRILDVYCEIFVEEYRENWSIDLYFKKVFIEKQFYIFKPDTVTPTEAELFQECFEREDITDYLKPGEVNTFCTLAGIPHIDMLTTSHASYFKEKEDRDYFIKRGFAVLGRDFTMDDWVKG